MEEEVTVRFDLHAPGMNRHRVSVWADDGGLLSPPSAEIPVELSIEDGATIFVEASVPAQPTRARRSGRDERRWELRAASDAHAVLNLGRKGKNGNTGTAIEIRVDGAAQRRASR